MDYNMSHPSARKAYDDISNITDYEEVELLFRRATKGCGDARNRNHSTAPLSELLEVREKLDKAMNKMLDSGREGHFTYIQGDGDSVYCQLAKEELKKSLDILKNLRNEDWGDCHLEEKIYEDDNAIEAIRKLIQICDEIIEKTM
jgi:CRISPR/Cas system CSM-associated protein Csm2 small subunit